jgi:hypothetical protein
MKAKSKAPPQPKRHRGAPPHVPTHQTLATVKAMAGAGYSQAVIARHVGIAADTLRLHYREELDNSTERTCTNVFVNLVRIATTGRDNAAVQAGKFILSVRAGWKEASKVEIEQTGRGLGAILKMITEAPPAEVLVDNDHCHTATTH